MAIMRLVKVSGTALALGVATVALAGPSAAYVAHDLRVACTTTAVQTVQQHRDKVFPNREGDKTGSQSRTVTTSTRDCWARGKVVDVDKTRWSKPHFDY